MRPEEYYKELIRQITEREIRLVAELMLRHVGEENAIETRAIANYVYGKYNENTDRKVRFILEKLVTDYGIPVGARSGKSGRWLCKNRMEIEKVLADLKARKDALVSRIDKLEKLSSKLEGGQRPLFIKQIYHCEHCNGQMEVEELDYCDLYSCTICGRKFYRMKELA